MSKWPESGAVLQTKSHQSGLLKGWNDGPAAMSSCCYCRGPWFSSWDSCCGSQASVTSVPGESNALFWPPKAPGSYKVHIMHTCTKINKYRKTDCIFAFSILRLTCLLALHIEAKIKVLTFSMVSWNHGEQTVHVKTLAPLCPAGLAVMKVCAKSKTPTFRIVTPYKPLSSRSSRELWKQCTHHLAPLEEALSGARWLSAL